MQFFIKSCFSSSSCLSNADDWSGFTSVRAIHLV